MLLQIKQILVLSVSVTAAVFPSPHHVYHRDSLNLRFEQQPDNIMPFTLPIHASNSTERAQAIAQKRSGFLYGPSIMGNSSFFPTGPFGTAMVQRDIAQFSVDEGNEKALVASDLLAITSALTTQGAFQSVSDYTLLYQNEWKKSIPTGVDAGQLTNYTNDLLFSMERLSVNPYTLRRLVPEKDSLSFMVSPDAVLKITGTTLESLFQDDRLFYVDHRIQATLAKTERHSAACEAYFYVSPDSDDFLPLAVKTGVGSNLIYTPLDHPNDWLLAKIMFNINDIAHSQAYHLISTHAVCEILYEAAIRTLSDDHPVLGLLARLMYQSFAFRPAGVATLTNPGGAIDTFLGISGTGFEDFANTLYYALGAGAFRSNYLCTNLQSRGLLNNRRGPPLKRFPFYEDASRIHLQLEVFMTSFVDSYYANSAVLEADTELQAWFTEANTAAQAIDFPTAPVANVGTLVDILSHFAFLTGVSHHVLNTGEPATSSAVLPFHPGSLYAPIPTQKGVKDLFPFLPPLNDSLGWINLWADFNRPDFANSNLTLSNMFSNATFLAKTNRKVEAAAGIFKSEMQSFSAEVRGRGFDREGLSQGMPFVWKILDPETVPYFLTI